MPSSPTIGRLSRFAVAGGRRAANVVGVVALVGMVVCAVAPLQAEGAAPAVGEAIYRDGLLPGGQALVGTRSADGAVNGKAAACVNCHRRSGLGTYEGTTRIPPITSTYLFAAPGQQPEQARAPAGSLPGHVRPTAYTDSTLIAAIRDGIGRDGKPLSELMPRYALDEASMRALVAYLRSLPTAPAPGVTDTTLHFATVVTPDADPVATEGMLKVLQTFAEDKNAFIRGGRRPLRTGAQIDYRDTRRWELHVWRLTGAPGTWRAQLEANLKKEPVFALLSGLAGPNFTPVAEFCEHAQLPCLFPNADLPPVADGEFYSLYLSKGVLLEADMMAARLDVTSESSRVVQVYRGGGAGERAARALKAAAPRARFADSPLAAGPPALATAIAAAAPGDTLVLWLEPADLSLLPAPPDGVTVWVSGLLAGLDARALPPAWRRSAQLTYPVDLPAQRQLRLSYPLHWFAVRNIPVVAERVQADTYLACGIVAEALADVTGNYQRDYLIERIEIMLSHRQLSGYYPRLSLGPGQRFASKGGYWVRGDETTGAPVAVGEWTIP